MKKPVVTILQYLFFLGLGILFAWLSLRKIDHKQWLDIKDSLTRARHWLIIPAFVLLFIAHGARAMRWKILMEPMGYKPSNFNTFAAVMIGYLVNAGVPRLGEIVRCTLLAKYEKIRADSLIGTVVAERAVDAVCLVIVFLLTLVFQGHIIGVHIGNAIQGFFTEGGHSLIFNLVKWLLIIGGVIFIISFILRKFAHTNVIGKVKKTLQGISGGLGSIRKVRHKGWFLFHTCLMWAAYLMGTTIGIYALQETAHLGVGAGLTTLAVGSIGMIITPGGIGAYPLLVSSLMGWYGLDEATIGNALGWLLWSVQTIIVILGGLICFALLSHHNKEKTIETRQEFTEQIIHPDRTA